MSASEAEGGQPRRTFVKEAATIAIGGAVTVVPVAAGLVMWLDPLRSGEGAGTGDFIQITTLEALPADGVPRKFSVVADRQDAWTRTPQVPIGALYLTRTGQRQVVALQCVCPHAGCFLEYRQSKHEFFCPCHNSTFAVDGRINDPKSPSPRPMDDLAVELRGDQIWVRFQNFQAGHRDKRPIT